MIFEGKVPEFSEFINEEKENNTESMKNYKAYLAGKEPLKYAIINHREGDDAYDFVKSKLTHNFSVFPEGHWDKVRQRYREGISQAMKIDNEFK